MKRRLRWRASSTRWWASRPPSPNRSGGAVQPELPGLFKKYTVRNNDTGADVADCFVLRPTRDTAARAAVAAYAQAVQATNAELAADLYTWLGTIYGNL